MTNGFKPLNDAGVPADGTFDFNAALDADPMMPKYSPPSVGNTHNKVHRKLQQAQQLAQNHLDNTGNDSWFYVSAEYVDCRSVEEQELSGAEELDDVDVVVYVLSRDMQNQTGAAIRLPQGRIDGAQLREMLDDAMVYVMKDVKRQVTEPTASEPARDTAVPVAVENEARTQPTGGEDGDFDLDDNFYDSGCPCCVDTNTWLEAEDRAEGEDAQDSYDDTSSK